MKKNCEIEGCLMEYVFIAPAHLCEGHWREWWDCDVCIFPDDKKPVVDCKKHSWPEEEDE